MLHITGIVLITKSFPDAICVFILSQVPRLTDSGLKKTFFLKKSLRVLDLHVNEGLSALALHWLYTELGLERVTRNHHVIRRDTGFTY